MGSSRASSILFLLPLLACWIQMVPVLHVQAEERTKLYIVYMGEKQHEDPNLVTASHHDMLASILGSKEAALDSIVYSYKHAFSGFAAMLTDSQAKEIAGMPSVNRVAPSRDCRGHTTRSWDYLGLDYQHPTELLQKAKFGEDIIIGIIDSGIWPESRSFSDEGYGPIPSRWKGICQTGEAFGPTNCSRKIIGARWYAKGVDPKYVKDDYSSARDANGHGTHTSSTAAGSPVEGVSYGGGNLAAGTARGGAPRARVAVYKAMWGRSVRTGNDATVLAAMDDAIHDGVDIISLSLVVEEDSFGSLHAVARGITVVYAAGNAGPAPQTVGNSAPWVITVAASTIDRSYPTTITLGSEQTLVGQALYHGFKDDKAFRDLVYGGPCLKESLNNTNIQGQVVLCVATLVVLPVIQFSAAVSNVVKAGGTGIIFAQYTINALDVLDDCKNISCVLVDFDVATQIGFYIEKTSTPAVKLSPTVTVVGSTVLSPKVAAFSSRGPNTLLPWVLKPDIAAPGVSILAAKQESYVLMSGTSMATPHVAGVVALLRSVHPDWSPAAIKSALVTTASTVDGYGMPIMAEGLPRKLADPFDYGGGHINPNKATDPGLVYDIDPKDYGEYTNCSLGEVIPICDNASSKKAAYNLNLPSIAIPNLKATSVVTVSRTVTNVGGEADAGVVVVYKAFIQPPLGVEMEVKPTTLVFNATTKMQTFQVTFSTTMKVQGDYTFGSLTWSNGKHLVRIPIAVRTVIQDYYADVA